MAHVYRPAGWPEAVATADTEDWEASAVGWIVTELVPDLRDTPVRRYPLALAVIARNVTTGSLGGARDGYRRARSELGEDIPPHVIDIVLAAYQSEGRWLAAATKSLEWVERALRGEIL